jgi:hypothetical protein
MDSCLYSFLVTMLKLCTQQNIVLCAGAFSPQTADNQQWISDSLMPSFHTSHVVHVCPKHLPFCSSCPRTSTNRLGYDEALFHRHTWPQPLVVDWCTKTTLSYDNLHYLKPRLHYRMIIYTISKLLICQKSSPCPNALLIFLSHNFSFITL